MKDDLDENDDRTFMLEVANHLLADTDEVRMKLIPNLVDFINLFPAENQMVLLNSMIRERLVSPFAFHTFLGAFLASQSLLIIFDLGWELDGRLIQICELPDDWVVCAGE